MAILTSMLWTRARAGQVNALTFGKAFQERQAGTVFKSRFCWLAIYMSNKSIFYKATNVGIHPKRNMSGVEQK